MTRAADIIRALGGKWYGSYGVARCPAHDDKKPSLSVSQGASGKVLFKCHANCERDAVLRSLKALGLWHGGGELAIFRRADPVRDLEAERKRRANALRIWASCQLAAGTLVETYLAARGIHAPPPDSLRFSTVLWHYPTKSAWPAMVALIVNEMAAPIAIHRTYLAADGGGKAAIDPNKMMLGSVHGGAVRLGEPREILALTEGIESGLAFQMATGLPTWACLSTSGLEAVMIPRTVREVVIGADGDPAGRKAALATAHRLARTGRSVRIVDPGDGVDFNDVVRARGAA